MSMTANQIIREIANLPPEEQAKISHFTRKLDTERQLTGEELAALADRLIKAQSREEAATITDEMVRGFYGNEPHA